MDKTIALVKFFLEQDINNSYSASLISKKVGFSVRTVRTYVNNINATYNCPLIVSSNKGYKLNSDYIEEAKAIVFDSDPYSTYEVRKETIIQRLLFTKSLSLKSLSDEFSVAESTLRNEISRINTELNDRSLYIKSKNNYIYLLGKDKDLKKYAISMINSELEKDHFSIQSIQKHFKFVDLNYIRKTVTNTLNKYEYFMDDYALLNYVIHLALCIELRRDQTESLLENNIFQMSSLSPHIFKIISEIYECLRTTYNFSLSSDQLFDASMLMLTRIMPKETDDFTENIEKMIGNQASDLYHQIIKRISAKYGIYVGNDSSQVRFALHLKNLLFRLDNQIDFPFSEFRSIKEESPYIYVIAVYVSTIIQEYTGKYLNENEISYIALHLGIMISESKAYHEKIRCVLLFMNYYAVGKIMMRKITEISNDIIITDIISSYKDIRNPSETDLIITNYAIDDPDIRIPVLRVNTIISKQDAETIKERIESLKAKKHVSSIFKRISRIFSKEVYYYNPPFHNKNELLNHMCEHLQQLGYVDEDYKKMIFEHEKIASSAYGSIAIPHPLTNQAKKTVISVAIFSKPLEYDNNMINAVFMLALTPEDEASLQDIFSLLVETSNNNLAAIINCTEYEQFINLLIRQYE